MLKVIVKLFGTFRIDRFKEEARDFSPGTKVQEVVVKLRVPRHLLGIVLINGVHADVDDVLHEGDSLSLLPLLGGG